MLGGGVKRSRMGSEISVRWHVEKGVKVRYTRVGRIESHCTKAYSSHTRSWSRCSWLWLSRLSAGARHLGARRGLASRKRGRKRQKYGWLARLPWVYVCLYPSYANSCLLFVCWFWCVLTYWNRPAKTAQSGLRGCLARLNPSLLWSHRSCKKARNR